MLITLSRHFPGRKSLSELSLVEDMIIGILAVLLASSTVVIVRGFPWLPISGSFLDVAYDNRLKYANEAAHSFSCAQWRPKVEEVEPL